MPHRRATRLLALVVPSVLIALIAAGYLLGSALAAREFPPEPPLALVLTALLVQAGALAARIRFPWPALLVISAGHIWLLIASNGELSAGALALMLAAYHVALARPGRATLASVVALSVVLVIVSAVTLGDSDEVAAGWRLPIAVAQALLSVGVPYVIAEIVSGRRRLVEALRERAELAEQAREKDAAAAAERERTQIARELHDIAAHHLTGIILSTQAARATAAADPEASRAHSETAAKEARLALDGIRATVGLLRDSDGPALAPLPGYGGIPRLVAEARGRGVEVAFDDPPKIELGATASLATYRMVQESLANARAHAPGASVAVQIEADAGELRIVVSNDAGEPSSPATREERLAAEGLSGQSLGLRGMRERAQLLGGVFTAAPDGDGWRAELRLPLTGVEPVVAPTEGAPE